MLIFRGSHFQSQARDFVIDGVRMYMCKNWCSYIYMSTLVGWSSIFIFTDINLAPYSYTYQFHSFFIYVCSHAEFFDCMWAYTGIYRRQPSSFPYGFQALNSQHVENIFPSAPPSTTAHAAIFIGTHWSGDRCQEIAYDHGHCRMRSMDQPAWPHILTPTVTLQRHVETL